MVYAASFPGWRESGEETDTGRAAAPEPEAVAADYYLLFLILLLAWLGSYLIMTVEAEPPTLHKMAPAAEDGSLPGDDTPATTRCYLTGEEMEAAENELIEAALLARSHKLEGATITFYCCEERPHICGTGTGITASGTGA